jgi:hypothetical protein
MEIAGHLERKMLNTPASGPLQSIRLGCLDLFAAEAGLFLNSAQGLAELANRDHPHRLLVDRDIAHVYGA